MMSLWDALRMNMMISYQELVRTFLSDRLVVMRNKTIADIYSCENLTQTQVMTAATGVR